MKNVTVSLDDDTYRRARIQAAERGRSLSSMVRDYLRCVGDEETTEERRRRELGELFARLDAQGGESGAVGRVSRDELYDEIMRERSPTYYGELQSKSESTASRRPSRYG